MLRDVRTVLSWLPARLRWRWYLLVPVAGLAAAVEAAGALAVFELLRLVVEPGRARGTPLVSQLWRLWPSASPRDIVALLALGVGAFHVARAAFLSWAEWLRQGVVCGSSAAAAERLLARYLAADYLFHARRRSASLIEPMARSSDIAFELVAGSAVNVLAETVVIAALTSVLVVSAPPAALATVLAMIALVAVPVTLMRHRWVEIGDAERSLTERQLHVLQQALGAIKDVKLSGRQAFFESRFGTIRHALSRARQQRAWAASAARLGVEAALVLSLLIVVFQIMRQDAAGGDTVSVLALFAYAGFRVVPSANRLILNVGCMREGHPWVRGMDDDMRGLERPTARALDAEALPLRRALVCEHVSLVYEEGARPALDDVSLTIRCGQSVGVVGPTGSGKSTLVDVLLGLLTPTSGRVLVDGSPIAGRERAWQRQIGYVPQDVYLLDDTLGRNIAFGVPDAAIDEARLARAVTLARLDEVVAALPAGLASPVGEDGVRLSGGQRQRVAIARALYHDPPLLIFDEATAALDRQTEREVAEAIAAVRGTRTVIAIAHRLSTVRGCDQLIYLRDGRVAGVGTYEDLLKDPGFSQLV